MTARKVLVALDSSEPNETQPFTIVAASDGSWHGRDAVVVAGHLAQVFNATLKLLVVVDEHEQVAYGQQLMQEMSKLVSDRQLKPEVVPLVGYTEEVVESYLAQHPADLLVIGAFKDRGAGTSANIGRTAQNIVEYTPLTVLIVKGSHPTMRKMLACVAEGDENVVEVAVQFAAAVGAQLQLIYVVSSAEPEAAPPAAATDPVALNDLWADGTDRAEFLHRVVGVLEAAGLGRDALQIRLGTTANTILEMTRTTHYELVIVGSQSGPRYYPGSTADAVVRFAPQSVLVVRTKPQ